MNVITPEIEALHTVAKGLRAQAIAAMNAQDWDLLDTLSDQAHEAEVVWHDALSKAEAKWRRGSCRGDRKDRL